MEFRFLHILAFVSVLLVASCQATSSPEDYWKSVLPNSPMPQVVKDLLHPDAPTVGVNKGRVDTGRGKTGGTTVNAGPGGVGTGRKKGKPDLRLFFYNSYATEAQLQDNPNIVAGADPKQGKPDIPFFGYKAHATEAQLQDNPNIPVFFLEQDLYPGKELNMQFSKTANGAKFLRRQVTDSMPFSSKRMPEILNRFSLSPDSEDAKAIKKTIQVCEATGVQGEVKFCATSLESMIDFATSKLGGNVRATSTYAEDDKLNKYNVVGVKEMPSSDKSVVVCHQLEYYAYAVFYCHTTPGTVAYEVSMVAADKSRAEAVVVCHRDTAAWNPKHMAFQLLKVKPGTVPLCHILPDDHMVWVPKNPVDVVISRM